MSVTAVIPARYASTRFPGKPLFPLRGKPMILHVAERVEAARAAGVVDDFLVATDDARIRDTVAAAGFAVRMTRPGHPTGTDRLAEVAAELDADIVCNVQGDEPLVEPAALAALIAPLRADAALPMATLKTALDPPEARLDPNRVKLVVGQGARALTFSRLPLVDGVPAGSVYFNRKRVEELHSRQPLQVWIHIGTYAYRREFLLRFASLPQTPFERAERLEQLRALEHGFEVAAASVAHPALAVDTPADVERVEAALAAAEG